MTEWQPIETAPRDGGEILLFEMTATGPMYRVGYWETHGTHIEDKRIVEGWSPADDGYLGCIEPTHWQPLPTTPSTEGTGGANNASGRNS